jgi:hypothetical protein
MAEAFRDSVLNAEVAENAEGKQRENKMLYSGGAAVPGESVTVCASGEGGSYEFAVVLCAPLRSLR